MPTGSQDVQFSKTLEDYINVSLSGSALDGAIEWIKDNLDPEDIFTVATLELWAEKNGYNRED